MTRWDVLFLTGAAMAAAGLWLLAPWLCLVAVGAAVALAAVALGRRP